MSLVRKFLAGAFLSLIFFAPAQAQDVDILDFDLKTTLVPSTDFIPFDRVGDTVTSRISFANFIVELQADGDLVANADIDTEAEFEAAYFTVTVPGELSVYTLSADMDTEAEFESEFFDITVPGELAAYAPLAGAVFSGEVTVDDLGLAFNEGDTLTDCSTFPATGGGIFFDDSEGILKKCEDNVLSDLDTSGGGGGSAVIVDLGDDGGNDTTDLDEIAITGDTNSIFSVSADKLSIALANNWPTADVANSGDSATSFFSSGEIADARIVDTITASNYMPLAGGTMTGQLVADNLGVEFTESDTNPTCSSGNYSLFADLSETTIKACNNGTAAKVLTSGDVATTLEKNFTFYHSSDLTTYDEVAKIQFANAVTITEVACATDTGTADINFYERAEATPTTGTTNALSSDLQCDTTQEATTSFSDAAIDADDWFTLAIEAVASSPTVINVTVKYTLQ